MTRFRRPASIIAIIAVLFGIVFGFGSPASGQSQTGWKITSYDSKIEMLEANQVQVTETIEFDFGSRPGHGIKRWIPVRYPLEPNSTIVPEGKSASDYQRITPVENISVKTSSGAPSNLDVSNDGDFLLLKVGDKDRTITGSHTYELSYTVDGVYNTTEFGDEFFWNVTGDDWGVPIANVKTTVIAPASITKITCFAGVRRSTAPCTSEQSSGATATFTQTSLPTGQGLTTVTAVPAGTLDTTPILDEIWSLRRAFSLTAMTIGIAIALLAIVAGCVIWLIWHQGRDRRYIGEINPYEGSQMANGESGRAPLFSKKAGPVEFRPPDDLRPGQVGVIIDEVANPLDVSATIIDLAVRGYLSLHEIEPTKTGVFSSQPDWNLVKEEKSDSKDLLEYERTLFNSLFRNRTEVKVSKLKYKFHDKLEKVQDDMYLNVVKNHWFPKRPDEVRAHWLIVGIGLLIAGIAVTVALAWLTTFALVAIPIVIGGAILTFGYKLMPHRTAKGGAMLARILGFRHFMDTAETERMQFAERRNIFEKLLPYAIVFGIADRWAETFKDLQAEPGYDGPSWYHGYYAFNAIYFTGALSSFTTTTNGTIVSTPPSSSGAGGSSGFSGGGFSGGGFGGGGGGGW